MRAEMKALVDAWTRVDGVVGCGDSACRFKPTGGMSTNGGCRCLEKPGAGAALADLYEAGRDVLFARSHASVARAKRRLGKSGGGA